MLWVDKYRPTSLEKLSYHKAMAERLARLATASDLPHLLFYGPAGAGKKTRIMALLRKVFGSGVEKLRFEHRTFKTPSGKAIEVTTMASVYHIEINPGDAGIHDRFVVQEVIKEMAQHASPTGGIKIVLLSEVDSLTRQAQQALRRTMEKYSRHCRLVLCCESPSRVIDPVRSRCVGIRVAAPTVPEVMAVLEAIGKKEAVEVPKWFAAKVAAHTKGNLRRAILMLEACHVHHSPFEKTQPLQLADWERFIETVVDDILREQSPKQLLTIRGKLYQLLVNCIPPVAIIKGLLFSLLRRVEEALMAPLVAEATRYEHRMLMGQKEIFHLEAFVAKTMAVLKRHMVHRFPHA